MKTTLLFLILAISIFAGSDQVQQQLNRVNKNFFIENKGQWPSEVKYLAKAGGMNAWITNSGVVYDYFQINRNFNESQLLQMTPDKKKEFKRKNTNIRGHVVKMSLVDANTVCVQQQNNQHEGYYNYFLGNDKSKWASFVRLYGDVEQDDIYKNINVKYYFDGNSIRYDYIIKPGADLSVLKLKFNGQDSIRINDAGELVMKTSLGEVVNGKLYSYQTDNGNQTEVPCKFALCKDGTISLNATAFDRTKELIIDPLVYSTFIGGSSSDDGYAIAIDACKNAYITGQTISADYPTTPGSYQTNYGGGNGFVTKLNPTGNAFVYSTFIAAVGYSIAIDACKNAYITGGAGPDYPTTPGAYQTTLKGVNNTFVTKLNPAGSALVYSTYIGGSRTDQGNSIAVDADRNAYITGQTNSEDYPVTPGAFQTIYNNLSLMGFTDCFVTKLNPTGSTLIYSTFIGGSRIESGNSIAVDADRNAYISGNTFSSDYPTTPGAYQTVWSGHGDGRHHFDAGDAFVTKLNPTGTGLVYSTFIGVSSNDQGSLLAIDADQNAYITGKTYSSDYPTTPGAYQTVYGGGDINNLIGDAFVTKLNADGNNLVYSTFIGGSNNDQSSSIAIDPDGNAYISGQTNSINYPTTPEAYQTTPGCGIFVTKLNPTGNTLVYSTFVGDISGSAESYAIAIDASGNGYITGVTYTSNYPTTPGAYHTTFGGIQDVFVTKLFIPDEPLPVELSSFTSNTQGRNIILNWSTQIEKNSNKFEIDRALVFTKDAPLTWVSVGTVQASGSSNSPKKYSYIEKNLQTGKYQFRLKMIDNDGFYKYSSVVETDIALPKIFELSQNYPNPFNPSTKINYTLPFDSKVTLEVYNITGERIGQLVNEEQSAGYYSVDFSSTTNRSISSGVYFYRITTVDNITGNNFSSIKKMILLK
jgi:hypothetical protein